MIALQCTLQFSKQNDFLVSQGQSRKETVGCFFKHTVCVFQLSKTMETFCTAENKEHTFLAPPNHEHIRMDMTSFERK